MAKIKVDTVEAEIKVMSVLKNSPSDPIEVSSEPKIEVVFRRPSFRQKHEGDIWTSLQSKKVKRPYNEKLDEIEALYTTQFEDFDPETQQKTLVDKLDEKARDADPEYSDIVTTLTNYAYFFRYYGILNNHVVEILLNDKPWKKQDSKLFLFEDFIENYYYNLPLGTEDFIQGAMLSEYFKWETEHFPSVEEVKK